MSARKLAIAALSAAALVAVAAPAQADAAAYVKRCTWWHLDGGDALVIDSLAPTTSCKAAKQLGDAYLRSPRWYPATLRAAGKTWRRIDQDSYDSQVEGCGGYGALVYGSYKSTTWVAGTSHHRYMADLEYEIEDGCQG